MTEGAPSGTVTFLFTDIESSTRLWLDHHLDAHHLASVDDRTRSRLGAGPEIDRALTRGAHLDRDQVIAYILEHLSADT